MKIDDLNRICFTVCIVCIVLGVVIAMGMIWWTGSNEIAWKGLATVSILFLAASLTLSVSKTFGDRLPPPDHRPSDSGDGDESAGH